MGQMVAGGEWMGEKGRSRGSSSTYTVASYKIRRIKNVKNPDIPNHMTKHIAHMF